MKGNDAQTEIKIIEHKCVCLLINKIYVIKNVALQTTIIKGNQSWMVKFLNELIVCNIFLYKII